MNILPVIKLTVFNGFLLVLPLLLIRFILPLMINRQSLHKLEYFPETKGKESVALKAYFISNTIIIFSPLLFVLQAQSRFFYLGMVIYLLGMFFFILSIMSFSKDNQFTQSGIYRYSRNPMYIGYFFIFMGMGFAINSLGFLFLVIIYQISVHYLILSEERWCLSTYQEEYANYFSATPRYLIFKK